jgi:hypothetical protein
VSLFVSILPSNHHYEVYIMAQKDVKDSLGAGGMSAKPSKAPKAPKIT